MSEYQYYEFLSIDRKLTKEEMAELRRVSSRAEITPTRFQNVYHYGDLKASSSDLMKKYFDAMIYVTNWGTHEVMFRLPKTVVDLAYAETCGDGVGLSVTVTKNHVVLDFDSQTDDHDWEDGGDWSSLPAPVRVELMRGDLRPFYLGWLLSVQHESFDDDDLEPSVPPGLNNLSPALKELVEYLRIDDDLLAVAAEASPRAKPGDEGLAEWIVALPETEKNRLLLEAVQGDGGMVGTELLRRFRSEKLAAAGSSASLGKRTVGELLAAAEERTEKRRAEQRREAAEQAAKRKAKEEKERNAYLDGLVKKREETWKAIERMIDPTQPKGYQNAASLLRDLRDVCDRIGKPEEFQPRFADLRVKHAKKPKFMAELKRVGLLS